MRITSTENLKNLRGQYSAAIESLQMRVLVCGGTGCVAGGSVAIYERLSELAASHGVDVCISIDAHECGDVGIHESACHGFCENGPVVIIRPQDWLYTKVTLADCEEILTETIVGKRPVKRLFYTNANDTFTEYHKIPFYDKQTRISLSNCGEADVNSLREYIARDGYAALAKVLDGMRGDEICKIITDANLRGRGGGGYPAGRKWTQVRRQSNSPKYIVCNGDEGDPGAFMDRSLLEGDPHKIIEGMIIAGLAVGSKFGYLYVRAEYPLAVKRLNEAIAVAREAGLLGDDIMGSGKSFDLQVNKGAGAFVCGEGSALTASIEGERGMPRVKPPRTVEAGLFGKPTVLNNVETFANVPSIILNGADWFRTVGTEKSPGTKAFAVTGNVEITGLIEVPMGTTLREIVFDICGGIKNGKKFKAVQIGGPSGGCLPEEYLDMPLDFDSLANVGAMIGSGGLVVLDEDTCMVEIARFFMNFTQNESCGKCIPCREGTKRMLLILERIVAGEGTPADIDMLLELGETISVTSLCGLGKSAASPVLSTLKYFR
ncbi:MAG: NuoF family protein, partial [Clostridia bacterium]